MTKYNAVRTVKVKESDVQRLILDWLSANKIWHVRLNTGSFAIPASGGQARRFFRAGKKGMADILSVVQVFFPSPDGFPFQRHQLAWIEVKAPKGVQSSDQKAFQSEVEAQGMKYILARSLEDVIEGLK